MNSLAIAFQYYKAHQNELAKKYAGKFIVIVGKKVVGSYDTEADAITESLKHFDLGTFLVQFAESGEQNITQTFVRDDRFC